MQVGPDWSKPRPEQLPRPSYAPPLMALGLMCLLWGAVTTWIISVIGIVLLGVASVSWIRSSRES
jgi:hypothetical protein